MIYPLKNLSGKFSGNRIGLRACFKSRDFDFWRGRKNFKTGAYTAVLEDFKIFSTKPGGKRPLLKQALKLFMQLLIVVPIGGCAGAKSFRSEKKNEWHYVSQLIPKSLRVRRPSGQGAHPQAVPGGADYYSVPSPNERYDCLNIEEFTRTLKTHEIKQCLKSITEPLTVQYILRRNDQPTIMITEKQNVPECIAKTLGEIPIPREIFFQSVQENHLYCFSARLGIEEDEWLGSKLPSHKVLISLQFPLSSKFESEEEFQNIILSWILTPFFSRTNQDRFFQSKVVPFGICRTCIGEKHMVKEVNPLNQFWPIPVPIPVIDAQKPEAQ